MTHVPSSGIEALFRRHETKTPHKHVAGDVGSREATPARTVRPQWLIMAYAGVCGTTPVCVDTSTPSR